MLRAGKEVSFLKWCEKVAFSSGIRNLEIFERIFSISLERTGDAIKSLGMYKNFAIFLGNQKNITIFIHILYIYLYKRRKERTRRKKKNCIHTEA